ncbi:glycosyltransferase involved in cell wall biosynthesis [Winogradskyella pacifica]|uniref:Glycosyltransferase involved in cell wall biosynthesis n=1 Tax=Winogradskyella pacifica TaxID=664642 RepID=A0A3D9N7L5_9FLAO|nr:glycosyltransferase [Winogradskyella pacifica]REE27446.1 glycosyltransferase involved in cell wall biosynthesis [Winogradskyella pacifica]
MKTAIISPSGKFYGSEQTLFNFLSLTNGYDVYIKNEPNGLFEKLKSNTFNHRYFSFNKLSIFYFLFSIKLLYKYKKVYINEAGHSKYIIGLSKLFFWKSFYIHVRLTEDTVLSRWKGIGSNIHLISTSKYIADLLNEHVQVQSVVISSPARAFNENIKWNYKYNDITIKNVGVIGRLTTSKGIHEMKEFFTYLEKNKNENFNFYFYGDVDKTDKNVVAFLNLVESFKHVNVSFEGFVSDKSEMYANIDLVLHFNKEEPLGVIFLEALNQGKPFVGFNSGGIGCIAQNLNLENYMVKDLDNWCADLIAITNKLDINQFQIAREVMLDIYSPQTYCKRIENLIS